MRSESKSGVCNVLCMCVRDNGGEEYVIHVCERGMMEDYVMARESGREFH